MLHYRLRVPLVQHEMFVLHELCDTAFAREIMS